MKKYIVNKLFFWDNRYFFPEQIVEFKEAEAEELVKASLISEYLEPKEEPSNATSQRNKRK